MKNLKNVIQSIGQGSSIKNFISTNGRDCFDSRTNLGKPIYISCHHRDAHMQREINTITASYLFGVDYHPNKGMFFNRIMLWNLQELLNRMATQHTN